MRPNWIIRSRGSWLGSGAVWAGVGVAAVALAVSASAVGARSSVSFRRAKGTDRGSVSRALKRVTACEVFTLADAETLIGADAMVDLPDSHTVDFDGQRNTQCAYGSGQGGRAVLQALIPLDSAQAKALKTAFARNQVNFHGRACAGSGRPRSGRPR